MQKVARHERFEVPRPNGRQAGDVVYYAARSFPLVFVEKRALGQMGLWTAVEPEAEKDGMGHALERGYPQMGSRSDGDKEAIHGRVES